MGSQWEEVRTPVDLARLLSALPPGTMIPAQGICEMLAALVEGRGQMDSPAAPSETWREKLWTVPPDTRIGVRELAQAMNRPVSWVYRRTAARSHKAPLPCHRLDGRVEFVVGEIRAWLASHEVRGAA